MNDRTSTPCPFDPRAAIRRLYRADDDHGYVADPEGEAGVFEVGSSPTYGEMMPGATHRLVLHLGLGPRDVFYDLGSGVGKIVVQVAMTAAVARCVGIELVPRRHQIAQRILSAAHDQGLLRAAECRMRHGDFMRAQLGDATVVYACSTAFPTTLMNALAARLARRPVGLRFVSTRDLDDNDWFTLEDVLRLDMSWRRRSAVHVYRLTRRRWR